APRQFAHCDVRDLGVGLGIDHRDAVGPPAGDVELAAVRRDRHVPRPPAHGNPGDDRVGCGIDHLHSSLTAGGHVDALAARMNGDAVGTAARLDTHDDFGAGDVENVDGVGVLGGDIRTPA